MERIAHLREELGWFYTQLNRADRDQPLVTEHVQTLQVEVTDREREVQSALRQLQQISRGRGASTTSVPLLDELRQDLAPDTALVEYFVLDDDVVPVSECAPRGGTLAAAHGAVDAARTSPPSHAAQSPARSD